MYQVPVSTVHVLAKAQAPAEAGRRQGYRTGVQDRAGIGWHREEGVRAEQREDSGRCGRTLLAPGCDRNKEGRGRD